MFENKINIPKYFQELHGEKASLFSLILVYLTALTSASIITSQAISRDFPIWKLVLFFVIVADIAGGAIANFTNSTNNYYQNKNRLSLAFIGLHIIHPAILLILFPKEYTLFLFMGIYAIVSCLLIYLLKNNEVKRLSAVFLTITGLITVFILPAEITILKLLPILFFIKLLIGFSVRHSNTDIHAEGP